MDCNNTRRLIEADVDGELDLVRHLELEAHLNACSACRKLAENIRSQRTALRERLPRFTAPPQLTEKIRASLRAEGKFAAAVSSTAPHPRRFIFFPSAPWITAMAASLALALGIGFAWGGARARERFLIGEAMSAHVRSLQAGHLTDVASTDQHTVKPWFAGKLDFAPPVIDLASAGFPLTGGRLEYLDGRPAAALVFHRRQHAINLFIWPVNAKAVSASHTEREGYHIETWSRGSFNFFAISDVAAPELAQFADAYRTNQHD